MEDRKAGLDLRTPPLVFRGSKNGPVVIKGSAEASPLFQQISIGAMPPGKSLKVSTEQAELIRRWIDSGAEAARSYDSLTKAEAPTVSESDRRFWAFRKPITTKPPLVKTAQRVRTPIDSFLLSKLEERNLSYAPAADRRTLVRRAYLDLLGVPPSPAQIDAFLNNNSPEAWERLVDSLLANQHFGERWGRHWLDAAGYADVIGIDNNSNTIRTGDGKWKYRDYVVRAMNQDKPYDEFLKEQLAGDEMVDWLGAKEFTPRIRELLEATGFLRNAADDTDNDDLNLALIRFRVLELTVQNVSSNLLGLTVGCAQCHTHKYDPIPQLDYYRMMAIFTPAYNPQAWLQTKQRYLHDVSFASKESMDRHNAELEKELQPLRDQSEAIRKPYELALLDKKLHLIPESLRTDAKAALAVKESKRNDLEKYLVAKLGPLLVVSPDEVKAALSPQDLVKVDTLNLQIGQLESRREAYGKIQAMYEPGPAPPSYFLRRGNIETPIEEVQPGYLQVLSESGKSVATSVPSASGSSGRRLAFANWLTAPETPASGQVARVAVNRLWMHLFGEGIVATTDNFGKSGSMPSHPELLDWLALEFMHNGWRVKPLIKMMMMSDAYLQSSRRPDAVAASAIDPANRLLWRMRLRRLEAEAIRDSILTAGGSMDPAMGGAPVPMEYRTDGMVLVSEKDAPTPASKFRRSLYMYQRRNFNMTLLSVFDEPVMATNCVRRNESSVVTQSLTMLNDSFVLEQADLLAKRVAKAAPTGTAARINAAFGFVLGRNPSSNEQEWSASSLHQFEDTYRGSGEPPEEAKQKALAALCHSLLNLSEFLYVE